MFTTIFDSFRLDNSQGLINLLSDTIRLILTNGYTPNKATHAKRSDITGEITGTGYTAGGPTLTSKTFVTTQANSWPIQRANNTAYLVGDIVRPATGNGLVYRCVVAGTSGGSIPTFSTVRGRETADGTVVWVTMGSSVTSFDAADITLSNATISATGGVTYKSRGGAASADELIAYHDFGGTITSTNSDFLVQFNATGILNLGDA